MTTKTVPVIPNWKTILMIAKMQAGDNENLLAILDQLETPCRFLDEHNGDQ